MLGFLCFFIFSGRYGVLTELPQVLGQRVFAALCAHEQYAWHAHTFHTLSPFFDEATHAGENPVDTFIRGIYEETCMHINLENYRKILKTLAVGKVLSGGDSSYFYRKGDRQYYVLLPHRYFGEMVSVPEVNGLFKLPDIDGNLQNCLKADAWRIKYEYYERFNFHLRVIDQKHPFHPVTEVFKEQLPLLVD